MTNTFKIIISTQNGNFEFVNMTLAYALKKGYKLSFYHDKFAIVSKNNKSIAVKALNRR